MPPARFYFVHDAGRLRLIVGSETRSTWQPRVVEIGKILFDLPACTRCINSALEQVDQSASPAVPRLSALVAGIKRMQLPHRAVIGQVLEERSQYSDCQR